MTARKFLRQHHPPQHLSTNEFADELGVKPHTVHRSHCEKGHYLGIKPIKLPNGRLLWLTAKIDKLLEA